MIALIMLALISIVAAFFATQNTILTSLTFGPYHLQRIPMYLIVLGSILIGLLVSSVMSFIDSVLNSLKIHGKDTTIKEGKKTAADLMKHNHQLELENMELKTEQEKVPDEKSL